MFENIFIGLIVVGITIIIQAYGTKFWTSYLKNQYASKPLISFDHRTVGGSLILNFEEYPHDGRGLVVL